MRKVISVILLSCERKEETLETLKSLYQQTFKDFEVIVVDQGSSKDVINSIRTNFQDVNLILLHKNMGVPAGRNIGAINANGEILIFLDNDAHFNNDAFEKVIQRFENNKKLGIVGFRIVNAKTKKLDYSSWVYQKSRIKDAEKEFETYTFCGAGHAIRREVFEKVGYYWDELFFGWEEMEFSIKVINNNIKILYSPDVVVYHRLSDEGRVLKPRRECFSLRNSLWVSWRYMPRYYALWESIVRIFTYLFKSIKGRFFFIMVLTVIGSFRRFSLIFTAKYRISKAGFNEFKRLSNKGPIFRQIQQLLK